MSDRRNFTAAPYAYTVRPPVPECPHCRRKAWPLRIRTIDQGDGSQLILSVCKLCSRHYKLIAEPLDSDDEQLPNPSLDNGASPFARIRSKPPTSKGNNHAH